MLCKLVFGDGHKYRMKDLTSACSSLVESMDYEAMELEPVVSALMFAGLRAHFCGLGSSRLGMLHGFWRLYFWLLLYGI